MVDRWKARSRRLKSDGYAVYLACRDPRVPRSAKLVAFLVGAYALSPIDLIPDFIPVVGYLDDLILVPAGVALVLRLIPPAIMAEHRAEAALVLAEDRPRARGAAAVILAVWGAALLWIGTTLWGLLQAG